MVRESGTRGSRSRRAGSRTVHEQMKRRRVLRRRLIAGALVLGVAGVSAWALQLDRPLRPDEITGSPLWASKYYGNPDAPNYRERNIVTIEFLGRTMFVHRKVERHFLRLESIFEARAPEYAATVATGELDDWSYWNRNVRGDRDSKSNHAFGLAVDVNALSNVMGTEGDIPPEVVEQWEREGGDWGGDWSRPDPMHFETHLTPKEIKDRYNPDGSPKDWYLEELVG